MPKLKQYPEERYHGVCAFLCPACKKEHFIHVKNPGYPAPVWDFNGDFNNPTITPSVKVETPYKDKVSICHSFIKNGKIEFCGDCTHGLRGQTVELPEIE